MKATVPLVGPDSITNLVTDPNEAYPQATPVQLIEAMGYVGDWLMEAIHTDQPFLQVVTHYYNQVSGIFPMPKGSEINSRHQFTYPGDPPQDPIVEISRGEETFRMYPHAICAFHSGDDLLITRID